MYLSSLHRRERGSFPIERRECLSDIEHRLSLLSIERGEAPLLDGERKSVLLGRTDGVSLLYTEECPLSRTGKTTIFSSENRGWFPSCIDEVVSMFCIYKRETPSR